MSQQWQDCNVQVVCMPSVQVSAFIYPEVVSMHRNGRGLASGLRHRCLEMHHRSVDQIDISYPMPSSFTTSCNHDYNITAYHDLHFFSFIHSFIHPCWRTNCEMAEVPPVITPDANSFSIVDDSIMIGWCNYFLSALLTGQRCVIRGAWRHGCFVGTPDIISDIGIPISGYPILYPILYLISELPYPNIETRILYPILYPISELPYPDIGTPDIVHDIVPDIGDEMSDIWVLIPDIGVSLYRDQYQSTCAPI